MVRLFKRDHYKNRIKFMVEFTSGRVSANKLNYLLFWVIFDY